MGFDVLRGGDVVGGSYNEDDCQGCVIDVTHFGK